MKRTAMVAFACFLGAVVGALVALEIADYFNWSTYAILVGAPIGGIVAYLTYDVREMMSGIARAFRDVIKWRPNKLWWKVFLAHEILTFCLYLYLISTVLILLLMIDGLIGVHGNLNAMVVLFILLWFTFFALISLSTVLSTCKRISSDEGEDDYQARLKKEIYMIWECVHEISPVAVVTRHIPKFILFVLSKLIWLVKSSPKAFVSTLRISWHFTKTAFLYIHSDIRTLCFLDATIGASVGFFAGSPIIGGVAGLVLGVINYKIISVRLLKSVPHS